MTKYIIIENSIEIPTNYYNGRKTIIIDKYTPGCSLNQQDQYPKDIEEFPSLEKALQALNSEKYNMKKIGNNYIEYIVEIRTGDDSEYYFRE